jgi:hypothetical protein
VTYSVIIAIKAVLINALIGLWVTVICSPKRGTSQSSRTAPAPGKLLSAQCFPIPLDPHYGVFARGPGSKQCTCPRTITADAGADTKPLSGSNPAGRQLCSAPETHHSRPPSHLHHFYRRGVAEHRSTPTINQSGIQPCSAPRAPLNVTMMTVTLAMQLVGHRRSSSRVFTDGCFCRSDVGRL